MPRQPLCWARSSLTCTSLVARTPVAYCWRLGCGRASNSALTTALDLCLRCSKDRAGQGSHLLAICPPTRRCCSSSKRQRGQFPSPQLGFCSPPGRPSRARHGLPCQFCARSPTSIAMPKADAWDLRGLRFNGMAIRWPRWRCASPWRMTMTEGLGTTV